MSLQYPTNPEDPDFFAKFDKAWKANFHGRWPNYNAGSVILSAMALSLFALMGILYRPSDFGNPPITSEAGIFHMHIAGWVLALLSVSLLFWSFWKVESNRKNGITR